MRQLPVFFNLQGRSCLLVGGDHAALCKAQLLLDAGALVHVNATALHRDLKLLLRQGRISFSEAPITGVGGSGFALVIVAEGEAAHTEALRQQCLSHGIPFNAVDQPALCSFTIPSIIDRDPITIAIGSGGHSPVLARRLRSRIESLVPRATGALAELLGRHRPAVARRIPAPRRREFWERALDGDVTSLALAGDIEGAERALQRAIDQPQAPPRAELCIVDARHNDSEKMTLQAVQALQRAEHLVHAPSLSPDILRLARRDAHTHPRQRLEQELTVALHRLPETLRQLMTDGAPVVLLINNGGWHRRLLHALQNRLDHHGLPARLIDAVEPTPAAAAQREVS